jgi:hypothetical protein
MCIPPGRQDSPGDLSMRKNLLTSNRNLGIAALKLRLYEELRVSSTHLNAEFIEFNKMLLGKDFSSKEDIVISPHIAPENKITTAITLFNRSAGPPPTVPQVQTQILRCISTLHMLFLYWYIHICFYTCIYINKYSYIYIHLYTYISMYTFVYMRIHMYLYIFQIHM